MRHEIKKVAKIVDELTTIFLREDTNEVSFHVNVMEDRVIIDVVDHDTQYTDEEIDNIVKRLNEQRQHEVEEYYWQLMGESDEDDELTLLSTMVDTATGIKRDGNLYLSMVRLL